LLRNIFDAASKRTVLIRSFKIYVERFGITMEITKDSIIGDILDFDPATAIYFIEIGMHCLGCPASRGESLEEACIVHGTDVDALVAKLNAHFAK
jgi:hybrid cluster-associated redox disulfide protein